MTNFTKGSTVESVKDEVRGIKIGGRFTLLADIDNTGWINFYDVEGCERMRKAEFYRVVSDGK